MKISKNILFFLTTFPNKKITEKIVKQILSDKIIACANIIPAIESYFFWKNKICKEKEVLVLLKTSKKNKIKLIKKLEELHPYDVPEILCFESDFCSQPYYQWLTQYAQ